MIKSARKISKEFFKANQTRLFDLTDSILKPKKGDIVLLKGPIVSNNFDDDGLNFVFPENLYFYLTGIESDVDTYAALLLEKREIVVFSTKHDPLKEFWSKNKTPADFMSDFAITSLIYIDELPKFLSDNVCKDNTIYLYCGINPYSNLPSLDPAECLKEILKNYNIDKDKFYEIACEVRVRKSDEEVKLISESCDLAVHCHKHIMKSIQVGMSETQISNIFSSVFKQYGANSAYRNIVCAGENGCYLHYFPSSKSLFKENDMILIDAACRLNNYCSDITRTYPVNRRFTQKQRDMYQIVLNAQLEAIEKINPGINWYEVHVTVEKAILRGLIEKGLVKGNLEAAWQKRVIYYFMPHGVGHYIGLYVHDLPGLKSKENDWKPITNMNLRFKRVLERNMVVTCEPGLYFNKNLLSFGYENPELAEFFNVPLIKEYSQEIGGIRIEDVIQVLENGCEVLTKSLPKTIEAIEAFMKS